MGNRTFEMHEYRQILLRMRLGETDRALSKAGLMGRRKLGEVRRFVQRLDAAHSDAAAMLKFASGEAAQVDFGKGPATTVPWCNAPMPSALKVMAF